MKALYFLTFLSSGFLFSQFSKEKLKDQSFLEEQGTYSEVVVGTKTINQLNINYNPLTTRVDVVEIMDFGNKVAKYEDSFYLDDIDKKSFTYHISELNENELGVSILILTKNESVVHKLTEWTKGKEYLAQTEEKHTNKIGMGLINPVSKYIADKYIQSWYNLTDCTEMKMR